MENKQVNDFILKKKFYRISYRYKGFIHLNANMTVDLSESLSFGFGFRTAIETNDIYLSFIHFKSSDFCFSNGALNLIIDNQNNYILNSISQANEYDNACYLYPINSDLLKKICSANNLDIELKGKNYKHQFPANKLIVFAKAYYSDVYVSGDSEYAQSVRRKLDEEIDNDVNCSDLDIKVINEYKVFDNLFSFNTSVSEETNSEEAYNYDSLELQKDLPILKNNYKTLNIKDTAVFSETVTIEHKISYKYAFFLYFNLKWIKDTSDIYLDFHEDFRKFVNEKYEKVLSLRFKEGVFTFVLDEKINYTLKLASSVSGKESQNGCDFYIYKIDKNILRKIGFAKRLDIILNGNDCDYSIKANDLINLAKTFDDELFGSPKHEMDYYKADYLYDKDEYFDANRYILAAIKEEPNNEKYKELAEKIKFKLIAIEFENYDNAQKLFNDKKFEESVKLLDSIYVVEKGEEIKALREKVVNAWVIDLKAKGDANMRKKNTVFAINNYKKALKLHPEDVDLQEKLKNSENVLGSKMKEYGKKALKIACIIVVLLIGVVIYGKVMEYKEEQEYIARIEKEIAEKEKIISPIKVRLNDICKDITANNDTRKYLSVRFKNFVDRAYEIVAEKELYGEYLDADMWTDAQDSETVTAELLEYFIYSDGNTIKTKVLFKDSHFGDLITRDLDFIFENDGWFVDDISTSNVSYSSVLVKTVNFLSRNGEE